VLNLGFGRATAADQRLLDGPGRVLMDFQPSVHGRTNRRAPGLGELDGLWA
jgi:hypothetical protein